MSGSEANGLSLWVQAQVRVAANTTKIILFIN